jgi:hypothetical protein
MYEIQGHKSNKIGPLDRVKDEYPSFIIEIAGELKSNCQTQKSDTLTEAATQATFTSHQDGSPQAHERFAQFSPRIL